MLKAFGVLVGVVLFLVFIGVVTGKIPPTETSIPNLTPSPINGGWGDYSICSIVDGKPVMIRECNNPTPAYGGLDCIGDYSQHCDMPWTCIDNISTPVRLNKDGDAECLSLNGRDCMWGGDCRLTLDNLPSNINPLTCGSMQQSIWGSTGYDNPDHWCYKTKASYKL